MANFDWEKFGDDIRKTVQDAVDSRDFNKLNQTITKTFNETMGTVVDGVRSSVQKSAAKTTFKNADTGNVPAGGSTQIVNSRSNMPVKGSPYFMNITSTKVAGILLSVTGFSLMGLFLVLSLISMAVGAFVSGGGTSFMLGLSSIFTIGFGLMGAVGVSMLAKARRFRNYIRELKGREYLEFSELSDRMGVKAKFLIKDIRQMIHKGWFKQGHIDSQNTCLMISNNAYSQYQLMLEQMEQNRLLEEAKAIREDSSSLGPEIQEIVRTGEAYIKKIRECNDAIPGVEISEKISRIEMLVGRIFTRVRENPDTVSDIRRLMDYYLPTTVKLLEAYAELDQQPVQGENIKTSKREIEKTLDTLNLAFEKMLDSMFQSTVLDVSSDISVLHTMLAQEGLTKDDFDLKK